MSEQENRPQGPQFQVQRIYAKDISYEAPQGPEAFRSTTSPKISQDITTTSTRIDDNGNYEVVLGATITAKVDDKVLFLCEVHQAGIFLIKGVSEEQCKQIISTHCPTMLFPYLRETVDNLLVKGTFPALMMPSINFDALYHQALEADKEKNKAGELN
ncbi:MAG: protein-export chaperone SecB [Pseudomonadales bacterium]|nr:protein-export chaperone SecB [Pseudomonadales bacterium]